MLSARATLQLPPGYFFSRSSLPHTSASHFYLGVFHATWNILDLWICSCSKLELEYKLHHLSLQWVLLWLKCLLWMAQHHHQFLWDPGVKGGRTLCFYCLWSAPEKGCQIPWLLQERSVLTVWSWIQTAPTPPHVESPHCPLSKVTATCSSNCTQSA